MVTPKTAIISGVTGQDGSFLSELLLGKNYRVIGLKRRTSAIRTERIDHLYKHRRFELKYFDLNDTAAIWKLIKDYKPDEFYNLAAQSHVRVSFDLPENTVDGIAMGTLRILNAIKELSPETRFYQASSSEMFGDNPKFPFNEDSKLMPASPYACAKVFAHNLVRSYRSSYGLHASAGILFNHESERRGETFVTRKITLAAARIKMGLQEKVHLGHIDSLRDWGYAKDYVKAMWTMLQQPAPDDYVISTGEMCSVRDFADYVFNYAGLGPSEEYIEIDARLFRPHEVSLLIGDASKAKNKLAWFAKTDVKGLAKIMYNSDYKKIKEEING
tara:strand:+ start:1087 stop:2076 length:990 start_codon:yes stop_codon:yes gene_type:complete